MGSAAGRTVLLVGAITSLALGAGVVALALTRDAAPSPAAVEGPIPFSERPAQDDRAPLPARTLEGFADGEPVALDDYRGRPLVINFWASWCGPCVEEMPAFQQVAQETAGEVAFLGVDVADAPRAAEPFVAEVGVTYDLALDRDRELVSELGVFAMPTTLFVDADGIVVHRVPAPLDADALRAALREHLAVGAAR
jgi:cytochrome c biogenesis protein CcmG/thiol:disulfide interchange protein DsbE